MKKNYLRAFALCAILATASLHVNAQSSDEVLNLMINKGVISQADADSLRADAAIKGQEAKEKQKSFNLTTSRLVQLSGYTQLRFQNNDQVGVVDGLDLRRVRLDLRGNILPTWDYRLQVDFAGTPKALDAYMTFKPYDYIKVQAGQFKVPFSLENIIQSNKMELIDRSQVVEALVARGKDVLGNHNGRDIGLMAFGSFLKSHDRFIIDYYAGVFDGQGINVPDKNNSKDFAGRIIFHPVTGLDVGGAYYNGYDNITTTSGTTTSSRNQIRNRYGFELSYTWKNLGVKSEFINGKDGSTNKDGYIERQGYYVQASYFIKPKKFQFIAKYDTYESDVADPAAGKGDDVSTWYILGASYFFNDYAKIQLNYSYKGGNIEDTKPTELTDRQKHNDLVSVQVQIGF
jgi:phosphate-selective porin